MIKIISEEGDVSTNYIIEYLLSCNANIKRLNYENYTAISLYIDNEKIRVPFGRWFTNCEKRWETVMQNTVLKG